MHRQFLIRDVPRRALQIFLAESEFSAGQALEWGLVGKVVAAADLEAETVAYASRLARTSIEAIANTKRLLRTSLTNPLEDQLHDEMESLIRCMGSDMFVNAISRFVAKG